MADESSVKIPDSYVPGLDRLLSIDDAEFERVCEALGSYAGSSWRGIRADLVGKLGWDEKDASDVARAVVSVDRLRDANNWTAGSAGRQVAYATNSPAPSDAAREALADRLERILDLKGVRMVARTSEAMSANNRTLAASRIFTELRPVLDDDEQEIVAMGLVYTLQIAYINGDATPGSIFVTLDDYDLDQLEENVDRARRGGVTLRARLEQRDIPVAPALDDVDPGDEMEGEE